MEPVVAVTVGIESVQMYQREFELLRTSCTRVGTCCQQLSTYMQGVEGNLNEFRAECRDLTYLSANELKNFSQPVESTGEYLRTIVANSGTLVTLIRDKATVIVEPHHQPVDYTDTAIRGILLEVQGDIRHLNFQTHNQNILAAIMHAGQGDTKAKSAARWMAGVGLGSVLGGVGIAVCTPAYPVVVGGLVIAGGASLAGAGVAKLSHWFSMPWGRSLRAALRHLENLDSRLNGIKTVAEQLATNLTTIAVLLAMRTPRGLHQNAGVVQLVQAELVNIQNVISQVDAATQQIQGVHRSLLMITT